MAGSNPYIVYWDSCVFISHFKSEGAGDPDRTPEERRGIEFWVDLVDAGEALIVTSSLTLTELLPSKFEAGVYEQIRDFLYSDKVELLDVLLGDIERAQLLRDYIIGLRRDEVKIPGTEKLVPSLKTPDAIHLASALNAKKCSALHTFDGAGERAGLLQIAGFLPAGHAIEITPPRIIPLPPKLRRKIEEAESGRSQPTLFDSAYAASGATSDAAEAPRIRSPAIVTRGVLTRYRGSRDRRLRETNSADPRTRPDASSAEQTDLLTPPAAPPTYRERNAP